MKISAILATLLCLLISADKATAQLANASLFPEVKSTNPAVISDRTGERITVVGKADRVKKEQKLDTTKGATVTGDANSSSEINSASFFRGGKGGGFTVEFSGDYEQGKQTNSYTSPSDTGSVDITANDYVAYLGLGLTKNFGISISHASLQFNQKNSRTTTGLSIADDAAIDNTANTIKAGGDFNIGPISLGLFATKMLLETKATINGVTDPEATKSENEIAGLAVGLKSKSFHLEVGYERYVKEQTNQDGGKVFPARTTGIIEADFGKFVIGYTGRYYTDGYFEIERIIYNQFVYQNSFEEPRLENTINFSFGDDKGSVISAAITYSVSDANEKSLFFQNDPKVATHTTEMGGAIKYSYAF